jgi:hypothetical protein
VVADQPNGTGEAKETGSATNESPGPPAALAGKTAGANGTAKKDTDAPLPSTSGGETSRASAPAAEPSGVPSADTPSSATNETPEPGASGKTGEIPTIVTAPVLVVAPPAEPAPAPRAAEPAPKAAEPEPEPDPVVRMVMVNATHGARFPGDVVTMDAEAGAGLARAGLAFPAPR